MSDYETDDDALFFMHQEQLLSLSPELRAAAEETLMLTTSWL